MLGVAPRSSRIILKVPVSSGRSENTRHTSPELMTGMSLPKRAVNDNTAWPAVDTPGGGATGGATTMEGCGNGAARLGVAAGSGSTPDRRAAQGSWPAPKAPGPIPEAPAARDQ